jgi:lipoprotein Spr
MKLLTTSTFLIFVFALSSCSSAQKSLRQRRFETKTEQKRQTAEPSHLENSLLPIPNEAKKASSFFAEWKGTPYRFGGNTKSGVDCSALVGRFYRDVYNMSLKRQTRDQFGQGRPIRKSELQFGDLVFFKNSRKNAPVDHVGIYVGNNLFFHASTSRGVMFSNLTESYYANRYVEARRMFAD